MIPCKFLNHENNLIYESDIPYDFYYKFIEACISKEPLQIADEPNQRTLYTVLGVRALNSAEKDISGSPVLSCVYVKVQFYNVFYYDV